MSTKKDKFSLKDKNYMKLAINLAKARKGLTGENPSVGCVIVKKDRIISIGRFSSGSHDTTARGSEGPRYIQNPSRSPRRSDTIRYGCPSYQD